MRLPNAGDFPPGDLRGMYLHWTGGGYVETFDAYHFCIAMNDAGEARIVATNDLRANMRDVRSGGAYAAHTQGRNSYAIGIAVCAMCDATPHDFGAAPLRDVQVEAACELAAILCETYAIPLAAVRTHAEAALDDGYFGAGDACRWDIARLHPAPAILEPREASATGDELRARVRRARRAGA